MINIELKKLLIIKQILLFSTLGRYPVRSHHG